MHKLEFTRQAQKELELIARADQRLYGRFLGALEVIARNPTGEGKPLHGELKGVLSHSFGSYRILYQVRHGQLLVIVIDLGHRRDIYK